MLSMLVKFATFQEAVIIVTARILPFLVMVATIEEYDNKAWVML